jgi:hypothetical protein
MLHGRFLGLTPTQSTYTVINSNQELPPMGILLPPLFIASTYLPTSFLQNHGLRVERDVQGKTFRNRQTFKLLKQFFHHTALPEYCLAKYSPKTLALSTVLDRSHIWSTI